MSRDEYSDTDRLVMVLARIAEALEKLGMTEHPDDGGQMIDLMERQIAAAERNVVVQEDRAALDRRHVELHREDHRLPPIETKPEPVQ